jgi:ATP adenylyltransferase
LDHLWTPWRMAYIQNQKATEGCVFCNALSQEDGVENLILSRSDHAFVILNRYPYTSGHIMVVPYAHQPSLENLDQSTRAEMMELAPRVIAVIQRVYKAQGFNIGLNIGEAAGAGIVDHVHLHIVPRWIGDTNFMSTLGGTRVLPETLEDTYQRLKEDWR